MAAKAVPSSRRSFLSAHSQKFLVVRWPEIFSTFINSQSGSEDSTMEKFRTGIKGLN
jgi:hypothetical protein